MKLAIIVLIGLLFAACNGSDIEDTVTVDEPLIDDQPMVDDVEPQQEVEQIDEIDTEGAQDALNTW